MPDPQQPAPTPQDRSYMWIEPTRPATPVGKANKPAPKVNRPRKAPVYTQRGPKLTRA